MHLGRMNHFRRLLQNPSFQRGNLLGCDQTRNLSRSHPVSCEVEPQGDLEIKRETWLCNNYYKRLKLKEFVDITFDIFELDVWEEWASVEPTFPHHPESAQGPKDVWGEGLTDRGGLVTVRGGHNPLGHWDKRGMVNNAIFNLATFFIPIKVCDTYLCESSQSGHLLLYTTTGKVSCISYRQNYPLWISGL